MSRPPRQKETVIYFLKNTKNTPDLARSEGDIVAVESNQSSLAL